jgi:hypothetical protein
VHTDLLLHGDELANASILDDAQLLAGYRALSGALPRLEQDIRPQMASHLVGAKGAAAMRCHA